MSEASWWSWTEDHGISRVSVRSQRGGGHDFVVLLIWLSVIFPFVRSTWQVPTVVVSRSDLNNAVVSTTNKYWYTD